jgi:hypothetical protein
MRRQIQGSGGNGKNAIYAEVQVGGATTGKPSFSASCWPLGSGFYSRIEPFTIER